MKNNATVILFYLILLIFTLRSAKQPLLGMELLEEEKEKDEKELERIFRKSPEKKAVY